MFRKKILVYFILSKFHCIVQIASLVQVNRVSTLNKIGCLYAIDVIDSIDDLPENTSNSSCAAANMDEFRKELTLKREARHRAIAAVSAEMERLKRELDAEKEAHSETSNMLAQLRSIHSNPQDLDLANGGFVKATMKEQEERKQKDESEKVLKRAEAQRLTHTLKVLFAIHLIRFTIKIRKQIHRYRLVSGI